MRSITLLTAALSASLFSAPALSAHAELTWSGGQLPGTISYDLEGYNVNCDLLIVMTESSLTRLFGKLDYLLA